MGENNGQSNGHTATPRLKTGLAEMLKGGVIMDVVTADQARIAEDAGATSVMALERVPADIRAEGGVARMSSIELLREISSREAAACAAVVRAEIAEAEAMRKEEDTHHRKSRAPLETGSVLGCQRLLHARCSPRALLLACAADGCCFEPPKCRGVQQHG